MFPKYPYLFEKTARGSDIICFPYQIISSTSIYSLVHRTTYLTVSLFTYSLFNVLYCSPSYVHMYSLNFWFLNSICFISCQCIKRRGRYVITYQIVSLNYMRERGVLIIIRWIHSLKRLRRLGYTCF